MSYERLVSTIKGSFYETLIVMALLTIAFLMFEPMVSRSATDDFTVTQVITGAIAFIVPTSDLTMVGSLDGISGGTSYGTTTARVRTNNGTGYNMTIQFSTTTAMTRNDGSDESRIQNYLYSTVTDSYPEGFDITPVNAQFGFSVNASDTSEVSPVFTHTGTDCGTTNNVTFTLNNCWRGASSTDETFETELISTSGPTESSGSTSTIQFRITIPNNPNPAVPSGTYVATATLTAIDN